MPIKWGSVLSVVLAILLLDRFSKIVVLSRLRLSESIAVFENIFHLTRVNNYGAAFGMMSGRPLFLLGITFFCMALLIWLIYKETHPNHRKEKNVQHYPQAWAYCLILAGATGNFYDRIRYGYVVDFLDFRIWPVFNLADIAISVGVGMVIVNALFEKKKV